MNDWCLESEDLAHLAIACPALQKLELTLVVQPSAAFAGLLHLSGSLHSLIVGGVAFGEAVGVIVGRLTQLQSLEWDLMLAFNTAPA